MNELDRIKFSTKILQLAQETLAETKIITEKEFDEIISSDKLTKKEKYEKIRTHLDISSISYCNSLINKAFSAYFDFLDNSEINLSNANK